MSVDGSDIQPDSPIWPTRGDHRGEHLDELEAALWVLSSVMAKAMWRENMKDLERLKELLEGR